MHKDTIDPKNFKKLCLLKNTLKNNHIPLYRFIPSNIKNNIIKAANELLEESGFPLLGHIFRQTISEQLKSFFEKTCNEYKSIDKIEEISEMCLFFKNNERKLKKLKNIPEDDDCKILKAFSLFPCNNTKFIISEDEHFWGYKDFISKEWKISVIEEWVCDSLI